MSAMRLIYGNEKGFVLPLGLMFLAIIAILGITAVVLTTTDLKIGSNYRASEQAFYTAEAGVQEALFRISLVNDCTKTIAQGGSQVSVNGVTNAYIGDPSSGGYDPNWQVKIYFVEDAATPDTATLLPKADWPNMNYDEVTIRHEKESDIGIDINADGDTDDLVFYDPSVGKNATNSPPGVGKPITWIESIGKSGTSQHKIHVEATKEVIAVDSKAAIAVNNPPNFTGNSSILGFNFKKETDPGFSGYTKTIDEIKGRIGDSTLSKDHYGDGSNATVEADGTGDVTIDVPYAVDGSGNWMLQDSGHLPGSVSTGDTISPSGSNAVFGGNGTKAWKDETIPSWLPIQDVIFDPNIYSDAGERLSMLNDLLARADITDADLETNDHLKNKEPMGIIHITGDLDLASDTPLPASGYGQGLIYVEGNLKVTGDIKFKGLVFVEGDVDIKGKFWNLGMILVKGTTINLLGDATTLYSKEVIDDLEDFTKTVKIISWKDVF
jgi:hypothetical protein